MCMLAYLREAASSDLPAGGGFWRAAQTDPKPVLVCCCATCWCPQRKAHTRIPLEDEGVAGSCLTDAATRLT